MERRSVTLTFDVDLVDWVSGQGVYELTDVMPALLRVLEQIGDVHATFFVRLDDGIARRFGRADYAFLQAADLWECVRAAGHEVAWHHHATAHRANNAHLICADAERPEADAERLLMRCVVIRTQRGSLVAPVRAWAGGSTRWNHWRNLRATVGAQIRARCRGLCMRGILRCAIGRTRHAYHT